MSLLDEYRKQFAWRDWSRVLEQCPVSQGSHILDLGCGPGDIAVELMKRGAFVTGIDGNTELLAAAKEHCPQGHFEKQDLRALHLAPETYDGLWCSFAAAYFTDFKTTFSSWQKFLKKSAWVCLTEIDELLGHEPLSPKTKENIQNFYDHTLKGGGYDFRSGSKIGSVLESAGFTVKQIQLADQELCFEGPAPIEIAKAWEKRLDRMGGLRRFFGENFPQFKDEYLQCLRSENHVSRCTVVCCVGTRAPK